MTIVAFSSLVVELENSLGRINKETIQPRKKNK